LVGTASTTQSSLWEVEMTKSEANNENPVYSVLPPLSVMVSSEVSLVSNPSTTICAVNGLSLPLLVSVDVAPFNDVTV
jgi:hypothetical protein